MHFARGIFGQKDEAWMATLCLSAEYDITGQNFSVDTVVLCGAELELIQGVGHCEVNTYM